MAAIDHKYPVPTKTSGYYIPRLNNSKRTTNHICLISGQLPWWYMWPSLPKRRTHIMSYRNILAGPQYSQMESQLNWMWLLNLWQYLSVWTLARYKRHLVTFRRVYPMVWQACSGCTFRKSKHFLWKKRNMINPFDAPRGVINANMWLCLLTGGILASIFKCNWLLNGSINAKSNGTLPLAFRMVYMHKSIWPNSSNW